MIESRAEQGYLFVRLPANFHHDGMQKIFHKIVAAALRDGVHKVLLDTSGMEGRLTGWPGYVFGDASQVFRDHRIRFAILAEPGNLGKLRFIENVAYNRSVPLGVFSSVAEAVDWLQQ